MKRITLFFFAIALFLHVGVNAQTLNTDSIGRVHDSLRVASKIAYKKSRQANRDVKQVNREIREEKPDTNRARFTNITRVGLTGNSKQYCASFNTAFVMNKKQLYDIGVGVGIEYFNRGRNFIELTQIPVYAVYTAYIQPKFFLGFEPGIMIPVNGSYTSDLFGRVKEIDYTSGQFVPDFFYNVTIGYHISDNAFIEFVIRSQTTGVSYPVNERKTMLGANIGLRL